MPVNQPGVMSVTRRLMRRDNRGQMAVMFLVFIGLIIAFTAMTMNLGEVAKLKTTTANAADAGALAAASWVASGENEAGLIAQGMWLNWLIVFLIFLIPFCMSACISGMLIALRYAMVQMALQEAADEVMEIAWENGQNAGVLTAIQNATVDDPSGDVRAQIAAISAMRPVPSNVTLDWQRQGADGVMRPSTLNINLVMSEQPSLDTSIWGPVLICWITCIWVCCWTAFGWGGSGGNESAGDMGAGIPEGDGGSVISVGGGGFWSGLAGVFTLPIPGFCDACFPLIIPLGAFGLGPPDGIDNGDGIITVTVTHQREPGGQLKFWEMKYPEGGIVSSAQAEHTEADTSMGFGDDPGSEAHLVGVL